MLLLVCILILYHVSKCTTDSTEVATCPTWTYPSPPHNECVCGASLADAIICNSETLTVQLTVKYLCIFNNKNLHTTLVGTCPYGCTGLLPRNVSQIEEDTSLCSYFHRKGQLCGECEDNYTLPAYSYNLGCVKCESYKNGWVKFIAAAFLPLILFYIVVIMFRISVTSSTLNAFVMVSQILASPPVIRRLYSTNLVTDPYHVSYFAQFSVDLIIAIFAIWNLDFFRSFYEPVCLYPDLNYQQVLLLEYAIGVYPLFLVFLTYILVKLHDNFAIVVWLWRPFHRCLAIFRRQWNIRSYLVHALATFIVLSYVKILNTSFEFLIPSHVYNMDGKSLNKAYWYYDGRVDMTSKGYLPYLVLSLFMLLLFNVLPLTLLALYPFRCFQRFLDCCLSLKCKLALQIYMDTFHGCYEDTIHDYRHFATLYLAVRFLNLLIVTTFNFNLYLLAAALLLVFTSALVAKYQPYKYKRSNTVDIILLLAIISGCMSTSMYLVGSGMFPKRLNIITTIIVILIYLSYLLFLILAKLLPKASQCVTKCKTFLTRRMIKFMDGEMNVEDQALLIH